MECACLQVPAYQSQSIWYLAALPCLAGGDYASTVAAYQGKYIELQKNCGNGHRNRPWFCWGCVSIVLPTGTQHWKLTLEVEKQLKNCCGTTHFWTVYFNLVFILKAKICLYTYTDVPKNLYFSDVIFQNVQPLNNFKLIQDFLEYIARGIRKTEKIMKKWKVQIESLQI